MQQSDTIGKLAEALAAAQGEMGAVKEGVANDFFKSTYADLATIVTSVAPVLSKHHLSVLQMPGFDGDYDVLTTQLMHGSGEWVREAMRLRPVKADPQSQGSAITYARRYAYSATTGVVTEADDDGNKASGKNTPPPGKIPGGGIPAAAEKRPRVPAPQHPAADTETGELPPVDESMEARRARILAEARAKGPLQEKAEEVQATQQRTRRSPMRPMP